MYLNHMSEHFKHRCTLCGYMTSYAGRLKRHLEDCHTADDDRPVATPRKPTLKRCRKCGFESTNLVRFETLLVLFIALQAHKHSSVMLMESFCLTFV